MQLTETIKPIWGAVIVKFEVQENGGDEFVVRERTCEFTGATLLHVLKSFHYFALSHECISSAVQWRRRYDFKLWCELLVRNKGGRSHQVSALVCFCLPWTWCDDMHTAAVWQSTFLIFARQKRYINGTWEIAIHWNLNQNRWRLTLPSSTPKSVSDDVFTTTPK